MLPYDLELQVDQFLNRSRYKVVCGQQTIQNNVQFGPFTGNIVPPSEFGNLADREYAWEVCIDD